MLIIIRDITFFIAMMGLIYILADTQKKFENGNCSMKYAIIVILWDMCVVATFVFAQKGY